MKSPLYYKDTNLYELYFYLDFKKQKIYYKKHYLFVKDVWTGIIEKSFVDETIDSFANCLKIEPNQYLTHPNQGFREFVKGYLTL